MSPLPPVPGGHNQPLDPVAVWVTAWASGARMRSPSRIALGFGLARSCSVCHALTLPVWVISFASLEQVVAALHPHSTSHVCWSQCHWAGVAPDGNQPHGCSVPQFPCL